VERRVSRARSLWGQATTLTGAGNHFQFDGTIPNNGAQPDRGLFGHDDFCGAVGGGGNPLASLTTGCRGHDDDQWWCGDDIRFTNLQRRGYCWY